MYDSILNSEPMFLTGVIIFPAQQCCQDDSEGFDSEGFAIYLFYSSKKTKE